ncbi:MAG: sugar phosphate isomerase/epimerase family protein [Candidatus Hydrogenedentales bacterium]|jgi:L-ribulose-5-phosphate 3-epimerase
MAHGWTGFLYAPATTLKRQCGWLITAYGCAAPDITIGEFPINRINRRYFLASCTAGLAAASLSAGAAQGSDAEAAKAPPLCVFSKHLQFLNYEKLAVTCRQLRLDGVDLTVRRGGHVRPERVAVDLPKAVDALRAEGIAVPMITTDYLSAKDPYVPEVLAAAQQCGISYCRIGSHRYVQDEAIAEQLRRITEDIRGLAAVAEEHEITAGYHNHSGANNFGAHLWDLYRVYEQVDSPYLGSNFDVGHAQVENGYGNWEITARLMAPWVRMMSVKDFYFEDGKPLWCPLGEGMVDVARYLALFRTHAGFAGPVSLHFEYKIKGREEMIQEIEKTVNYMRKEIFPKAGYGDSRVS